MMDFHYTFKWADLFLLLVVTFMVVGVAYIHNPRLKSIIFMIPLPFSAALISTTHGVDATHIIGITVTSAFVWAVWYLFTRCRWPIVMAIICTLVLHASSSIALARLIPHAGPAVAPWFWGSCAVVLLLAVAGLSIPHIKEEGYRSQTPVYIKTPLVLLLVAVLIMAREPLRGFMPTFPMVTIFGVYEARRCLYTVAMRLPIMLIGFILMAIALYLLLTGAGPFAPHDYILPLIVAWIVYIASFVLIDRWYAKKAIAAEMIET